VTAHNCAGLLHLLAARLAQAGHAEISGRLAAAAEAAGQGRDAWLRTAREVVRTRTVTNGHLSPMALEAGELATWTGRLAYSNPQWSPADGPGRPMRLPETTALGDVPSMIAAAHQACEAPAALAQADHDQIRAAARTGQILVPTRSLPDDYDIPYPFAWAPRQRVEQILARYGNVALSVLDEHIACAPGGPGSSRGERRQRSRRGLPNFRLVRYADLCRGRHKSAYAESRVMPTGLLEGLVRVVGGFSLSA
jgi:hypothetical protein